MKKMIHNLETGEIIEIDLTAEEIFEKQKWQDEAQLKAEAKLQAELEKATAKAALLEKLGITEEEAKLLLGGN